MIKSFGKTRTFVRLTIEEQKDMERKEKIQAELEQKQRLCNISKWRRRFGRITIVAGITIVIIGVTISSGGIILPIVGGCIILNGLMHIKAS